MKQLHEALQRRFGSDERGNVAMMMAVAIVPFSMAAVGGLDLTRSMTSKVVLQDALDAAALAAGRGAANDQSTLQQTGQRVLQQNLAGQHDLALKSSSFTLGADGKVVATAQATFQPVMAGLFGAGPVTINASTEVDRGKSGILEVAMVLDNTGSMNDKLSRRDNDTKIAYLRTAATNFVSAMSTAAQQSSTPNSVRISIVPFANVVNVGATYRKADWLDQDGVSPINNEIFTTAQGAYQKGNRFNLFDTMKVDWGGCVETRKAPYDVTEVVPTKTDPQSLFTPFFAPDELDNDGGNDYAKDPTKDANNNTISDWWRKQGDTAKYANLKYKTSSLNGSLGPNDGCNMMPVTRLTTDFDGLKKSISKMVASGETNIPLGLFWGWMTLSPNDPFADGSAYNAVNHRKIVVLMTDGENTMSTDRYNNNNSHASADGYVWQGRLVDKNDKALVDINSSDSDRTAVMNYRMQLICANMKKSDVNIEIYTVGVGVSTSSKALLQSCASGTDHYFDVTSGAAIDTAFQGIANQITRLHLSK